MTLIRVLEVPFLGEDFGCIIKKGKWFYIPKSMKVYDGYKSFEDYCDDNNLVIDNVLHQFVVYRIIHDFEFFLCHVRKNKRQGIRKKLFRLF